MPHHTPHHPPTAADCSEALNSPSGRTPLFFFRVADVFAFSSGLAATIGGLLSLIASQILDASGVGSWALLVASGTFIIYSLDRLRDTDRDRETSPMRTAFVLRNRQRLYAAVGGAATVFAATLLTAPPRIILLCMVIGLVGLLHRRLKKVAALKAAYVSLAWVAACVGIPWLASESGRDGPGPWLACVLFASLTANLIASNLRDDEGQGKAEAEADTVRGSRRSALWIARTMAILAIVVTLAAAAPLRPLVWIPVFEGLALACFRPTERYGQLAVDGALLVGAVATGVHLGWAAAPAG